MASRMVYTCDWCGLEADSVEDWLTADTFTEEGAAEFDMLRSVGVLPPKKDDARGRTEAGYCSDCVDAMVGAMAEARRVRSEIGTRKVEGEGGT